jgi:hypothetical protein
MLWRQISQPYKKNKSSTVQAHDLAATVAELTIESKTLRQPARATNSYEDVNEIW